MGRDLRNLLLIVHTDSGGTSNQIRRSCTPHLEARGGDLFHQVCEMNSKDRQQTQMKRLPFGRVTLDQAPEWQLLAARGSEGVVLEVAGCSPAGRLL